MGYPLEAIQATITSVTSATDLASMLDPSTGALKPNSVEITASAGVLNTTGQGDTAVKQINGLREWGVTVRALYPRASPIIGATSLVTFSAGQAYKVYSWGLNVQASTLEISNMGQTDATWKYFMPSRLVKASCSVEMRMESSTAATLPTSTSGSAPTVTFGLTNENTDPSIAGAFNLSQFGASFPIGEPQLVGVRYAGESTGALTATSGTSSPCVFPAGTVDGPDWDLNADGTEDVQLVFTAVSGRTYTGKCFWTQVDFSFAMDSLALVTVQLKGTGPLVLA